MIDRDYPFQVAVPAKAVGGKNLALVAVFHAQIGQPQRARSEFENDEWFEVYCFADPQHARSFQAVFNGQFGDVGRR
jgi:hypothetical protein